MTKEEVREKIKVVRKWVREEARRAGLPAKGRSYSDPHKTMWTVKIGLAPGNKSGIDSETKKNQWGILERIAGEVSVRWASILVKPAEAISIAHGCCCCAGSTFGILLKFKL